MRFLTLSPFWLSWLCGCLVLVGGLAGLPASTLTVYTGSHNTDVNLTVRFKNTSGASVTLANSSDWQITVTPATLRSATGTAGRLLLQGSFGSHTIAAGASSDRTFQLRRPNSNTSFAETALVATGVFSASFTVNGAAGFVPHSVSFLASPTVKTTGVYTGSADAVWTGGVPVLEVLLYAPPPVHPPGGIVIEGPNYSSPREVTLHVAKVSGPPETAVFFVSSAAPASWTTDNADLFTGNTWVTNAAGAEIGRQALTKAVDGSFALWFTLEPVGQQTARFELELTSNRPGETETVSLQIATGAGWVTKTSTAITGSAEGADNSFAWETGNSSGALSGVEYRWRTASGLVISSGVTPVSGIVSAGEFEVGRGFTVRSSWAFTLTEEEQLEAIAEQTPEGEVSAPDPDPDVDADGVPDPGSPMAADNTRRQAYEDGRAAIKDALKEVFKGGAVDGEDGAPTGLDDVTNGLGDVGGKWAEFATRAQESIFAPGSQLTLPTVGQNSVLVLGTLPNAVTLDTSKVPYLAQFRLFLAAFVLWYGALQSVAVLRSAFV